MYDEVNRHTFNIFNDEFIIDNNFQLIRIIGNGSYSTICSSRYINEDNPENNGALVAIKKIKGGNDIFDDLMLFKRSMKELRLLKQFRNHPNIVCLYDVDLVFYPNGRLNGLYLYEELLDCDLSQIIQSSQPLSTLHCQSFIYQILCGLKFIHSANVLHRDLKPNNILVSENCQLKICDFGLARGYSHDPLRNNEFITDYVSTRWYRAPEIMLSYQNYSTAVDVWSIGCIFAELVGRKPLFQGTDYVNQLNRILQVLGTPSSKILNKICSENVRSYIYHLGPIKRQRFKDIYPGANEDALDLLGRMLTFDPEARISVIEALNHPYLSLWHDVDEEMICPTSANFDFEAIEDMEILRAMLVQEIIDVRKSVRTKNNTSCNSSDGPNEEENSSSNSIWRYQSGDRDSSETIEEHTMTLEPPVSVSSGYMATRLAGNNVYNHDGIVMSYSQEVSSSSSSLEKDLEHGLDGKFS